MSRSEDLVGGTVLWVKVRYLSLLRYSSVHVTPCIPISRVPHWSRRSSRFGKVAHKKKDSESKSKIAFADARRVARAVSSESSIGVKGSHSRLQYQAVPLC